MNKKALIFGGGAVAIVAIVVALIFIFTGGEDAYRSIKVFEIDGTCKVERDGDTLDAFKNMALSSGDTLTVGEGSYTRLKLDDDKYVYLEANTRISLTATGTANDSKTVVYIERGSMLTEVKKKLSATSSYDIVTPNTTMSIRGTKTLTEVYEDVLGAIKTSAAVVEGQVKFSTIQKDKTGKAVIVSTDLTVGQGYGVTTESKDLLSEDDVKHIADDGKTVDGQTAEETTHEELGSVLETPAFSDEFLTNIVAVLARSREEDIEEGFTAEDVTEEELNAAINILNDVIEGKVELPAFVEEYIVSQSQPYYSEPVVVDTPVTNDVTDTGDTQTVDTEPVIADDPVAADEAEEGDDTFIVDGTGETLVGIDDADDTDDAVTEDDESDDQTDDADETDDVDDETGDDESDEADEADEDDNAGEEDEADSDDESDEDDEEEAIDEESAEEKEQPEESETDSDSQSSEPSTAQDPNASDERDPNGGGGSSSSTSEPNATAESISVNFRSTYLNIPSSSSQGGTSSEERVNLVFKNSNGETVSLPTSYRPGAPLPAANGTDIIVSVEEAYADRYEFTGWYYTESAEGNPVANVPTSASSEVPLYAGIREKTFTITFCNLFPQAGALVLPTQTSANDTHTYTNGTGASAGNVIVSGLRYGEEFEIPLPYSYVGSDSANVLRVDTNGSAAVFEGVGSRDDVNIAKIKFDGINGAYEQSRTDFYRFDADSPIPKITVTSNMTLYLYFSVQVSLQYFTQYAMPGQTSAVWEIGNGTGYAQLTAGTGYENSTVRKFIGNLSSSEVGADDQYWKIYKTSTEIQTSFNMLTYYFGRELYIPSVRASLTDRELCSGFRCLVNRNSDNERVYEFADEHPQGLTTVATVLPTASSGGALPLLNDSGKVDFISWEFEVMLGEFIQLDLGDTDISYQRGDECGYSYYKSTSDTSRSFKLGVSYMSNEKLIRLPIDPKNSYRTGEDLTASSDYDDIAVENLTINKTGYKVIGFELNPTGRDSETILIESSQEHAYGSIAWITGVSGGYYSLALNNDVSLGSRMTIRPIFAPLKPFDVNLTREAGTISRKSTDTDNNWIWNGYELEISGPGLVIPENGAPFVTYIKTQELKPYQRETTYYSPGTGGTAVALFNDIEWNVDSRKYKIVGNTVSQNATITYTVSADGKTATLKLKLMHLFNAEGARWMQDHNVHYVEYLAYYDENRGLSFNTCFNDNGMTDGWCAASSVQVETGYKPYKNYKTDVLADSGKYTVIDNNDYHVNGVTRYYTAIINEKTDSFTTGLEALMALSGYTDPGKVRYGGKLINGSVGASIAYSPVLLGYKEILNSGGNAGELLNGTAGPGHGILNYGTVNTVFIKGIVNQETGEYVLPSDVVVYNASQYQFGSGGTIEAKTSDSETNQLEDLVLSMNPSYWAAMDIALEDDLIDGVPNGWTLVTANAGKYYINYSAYGELVELGILYEKNG